MRVLLKKGAERATAETILAVGPSLRETVLTTLSGEGGLPGGVVAEVDSWTVADAIDAVAERHRAPTAAIRSARIEEVEWMAGILAAYELGTEVDHYVTRSGCALEISESGRLSGPILTPHERRRYEEADERGDYGSIACCLGRLGDARDATAQSLEELRRRPEARATDVRALKVQLYDYDRELADLRRRSFANPSG